MNVDLACCAAATAQRPAPPAQALRPAVALRRSPSGLRAGRALASPALAARRRGRAAAAPTELRIGSIAPASTPDISADAPGQRGELHRLEERDQPLVVRLVHGEIVERHRRAATCVVERHQLASRCARLVGVVDQRLAALVLLDLAGAREQRFEVAVFADELRGGLDADARHAGHVVGRIADQRLHVDHLVRRHAEFLHHLGAMPIALVLHGVVHRRRSRPTSCIRSLSEETMVHARAALRSACRA